MMSGVESDLLTSRVERTPKESTLAHDVVLEGTSGLVNVPRGQGMTRAMRWGRTDMVADTEIYGMRGEGIANRESVDAKKEGESIDYSDKDTVAEEKRVRNVGFWKAVPELAERRSDEYTNALNKGETALGVRYRVDDYSNTQLFLDMPMKDGSVTVMAIQVPVGEVADRFQALMAERNVAEIEAMLEELMPAGPGDQGLSGDAGSAAKGVRGYVQEHRRGGNRYVFAEMSEGAVVTEVDRTDAAEPTPAPAPSSEPDGGTSEPDTALTSVTGGDSTDGGGAASPEVTTPAEPAVDPDETTDDGSEGERAKAEQAARAAELLKQVESKRKDYAEMQAQIDALLAMSGDSDFLNAEVKAYEGEHADAMNELGKELRGAIDQVNQALAFFKSDAAGKLDGFEAMSSKIEELKVKVAGGEVAAKAPLNMYLAQLDKYVTGLEKYRTVRAVLKATMPLDVRGSVHFLVVEGEEANGWDEALAVWEDEDPETRSVKVEVGKVGVEVEEEVVEEENPIETEDQLKESQSELYKMIVELKLIIKQYENSRLPLDEETVAKVLEMSSFLEYKIKRFQDRDRFLLSPDDRRELFDQISREDRELGDVTARIEEIKDYLGDLIHVRPELRTVSDLCYQELMEQRLEKRLGVNRVRKMVEAVVKKFDDSGITSPVQIEAYMAILSSKLANDLGVNASNLSGNETINIDVPVLAKLLTHRAMEKVWAQKYNLPEAKKPDNLASAIQEEISISKKLAEETNPDQVMLMHKRLIELRAWKVGEQLDVDNVISEYQAVVEQEFGSEAGDWEFDADYQYRKTLQLYNSMTPQQADAIRDRAVNNVGSVVEELKELYESGKVKNFDNVGEAMKAMKEQLEKHRSDISDALAGNPKAMERLNAWAEEVVPWVGKAALAGGITAVTALLIYLVTHGWVIYGQVVSGYRGFKADAQQLGL